MANAERQQRPGFACTRGGLAVRRLFTFAQHSSDARGGPTNSFLLPAPCFSLMADDLIA